MLKQAKNIFFIGIKGVAMANLAVFLKKLGKSVTGSDIKDEFITDELLKKNNIKYQIGFDKLPKEVDLVVYSAAHKGLNNPLILLASKQGANVISQAELIGEIMSNFKVKIAVSGCHGKTTTSSLLTYTLNNLNTKPSYLVGVPFFTKLQGGDYQDKKYFVVEADEYGINPPYDKTPKFFKLNPDWIITTNIDFDHPDVFKDLEATKEAFIKFFTNRKIILNIDDENLKKSFKLIKSKKVITYGFSKEADYQITDFKIHEDYSEFIIKNIGSFKISLFGKHNISNATSVIVQLLNLGFKVEEIKQAIFDFQGAERRFEKIYKKNNSYLFDDYAHHPNEIIATINAARDRFKGKRIIIIFQPHTFSRTKILLKDFKDSLAKADIGFILPIFASARENSSQFTISSADLVEGKNNLLLSNNNSELISQLSKNIKPGDIIFTMGAGDVYKLKNQIITVINSIEDNSILKVEKNKDISHFLTLRNRVIAENFIEAKTREDLIKAKNYSLKNNLPLFIIGGGSNLAITKDKLSGLVVKNSYVDLKIISNDEDSVTILISSGYPVSLLISKAIENSWSGFEYHQGLPGTVGGAIYMNSKWTKPVSYFGDNLISANLIDKNGKEKKVNKIYFNFAYDYSTLQKTHEIVLEGIFKLKKDDQIKIKDRAKFAFNYRKRTQPFGVATSGCFFRNPGKISAGYLIDKAGLKNFSVGDYFVSPIHANFIINKGRGKQEDLMKLLAIIKKRVKEKFHVDLVEEVIVV